MSIQVTTIPLVALPFSRADAMLSPSQPTGRKNSLENHTWWAWRCWDWREHTPLLLTFHFLERNHMDMSHCKGRMKIQSSYVLCENVSLVNGEPILSHLWEIHVQGENSVSFFLLFFSIVSFHWRCAKLTLYEPEYQVVISHS